MIIIVPVDVKYKGEKRKAHTKFNCDSSDFKKFQLLGAWAVMDEKKKPKAKKGVSKCTMEDVQDTK